MIKIIIMIIMMIIIIMMLMMMMITMMMKITMMMMMIIAMMLTLMILMMIMLTRSAVFLPNGSQLQWFTSLANKLEIRNLRYCLNDKCPAKKTNGHTTAAGHSLTVVKKCAGSFKYQDKKMRGSHSRPVA